MEEQRFRELYQKMVEQYKLEPDVAKELLQKILKILEAYDNRDDSS